MTYVAYRHGDGVLRLADDASPRRRVTCSSGDIGADAVFERVLLSHGRIALRSLDGHFVHVAPDEGLSFGLYLEPGLRPTGTFEEILWPDGCISLRSNDLTFVTVDEDGKVCANRTRCEDAERLVMTAIDRDALPADAPEEITTATQVRRVMSMPGQAGPGHARSRPTFRNT